MTDKIEKTTMLYRLGDSQNPEAWNRKLETVVVPDDGVSDAQADGWLLVADLPETDDELAKSKPKPKADSAPKEAPVSAPAAPAAPDAPKA